jgi:hypothetical protein
MKCRAGNTVVPGEAARSSKMGAIPQYARIGPTLIREPFHRDGWV